jgi:hypothetical protein
MKPNPHQQAHQRAMEQQRQHIRQMQDQQRQAAWAHQQQQMQHMQDQQRQAAWVHQQQMQATYPVKQRSGCAAFAVAVGTFMISLIAGALIFGGIGYFVGGMLLDNETAIIGAALGGLAALLLAIVNTVAAVRR